MVVRETAATTTTENQYLQSAAPSRKRRAGFSMGGCLALEVLGNQGLAGRLAGVFSHASFLNDDSAA